ncbi:MAG: hypothetical protein AAFR57_01990 [Pseudomonadota bacterium]
MGRVLLYLIVLLLIAVAGFAVYAMFADLPAPRTTVEEVVPLDLGS